MKITKPSRKKSSILSRYTTLPVLLDMIERQCITLLLPDSWDDRNDREVILEYKGRCNLSCLLAICFTTGDETIHHWSAFAPGSAGCRIDFHLPILIAAIANQSGFRHGKVEYRKINKLRDCDLSDKKRPFIKRSHYRIEEEYRIIFESNDPSDSILKKMNVPIPKGSIRSITFSQDMPESVFESTKKQLGPKLKIRISQSTLFENKIWINKFKAE